VNPTATLKRALSLPSDLTGPSRAQTVVVMWQRFGPYHLARLRGAAATLAPEWRVVGLEVAERDNYRWSRASDAEVERVVLFPGCEYQSLSPRSVRRRTQDVLNTLQPSAVCVNGWAAVEAVSALKWCRANQRQAVVMSETFESAPNPLKTVVRRWRVRQFNAALVGGRLHARYLESLGYPPHKIAVGYDVIDSEHFARPVRSVAGRFAGLVAKRYFFANTRFLPRKGIDALLKAYARYRAMDAIRPDRPVNDRPWHLVISGSGEMEMPWKKLAESLGVTTTVHWPGFIQYHDLPCWYRAAGVFVHPARQEAWGLVVNEAIASNLPVIVGRRVGAACELVREGENGFLVDPDDIESFAALLHRVAQLTDTQRESMGKASRRIVSQFGPDRFGQALKRCLQE